MRLIPIAAPGISDDLVVVSSSIERIMDFFGTYSMNRIDQRLSHLRAHPDLPTLYRVLPFHTRRIVESLLETGTTFALMEQAGQCMHTEFQENVVLQILAEGDVRLLDSVTDAALDEVEHLLAALSDEDDTLHPA